MTFLLCRLETPLIRGPFNRLETRAERAGEGDGPPLKVIGARSSGDEDRRDEPLDTMGIGRERVEGVGICNEIVGVDTLIARRMRWATRETFDRGESRCAI